MGLFSGKKKALPVPYPPEKFEPILRSSICTGEMTACFRDKETGKVHEIMVIRHSRDLHDFGKDYHVDVSKMKTVY